MTVNGDGSPCMPTRVTADNYSLTFWKILECLFPFFELQSCSDFAWLDYFFFVCLVRVITLFKTISCCVLSMPLARWRALRPSLTEVIDFCSLIYGMGDTPLESKSHADRWNGIAVEPRAKVSGMDRKPLCCPRIIELAESKPCNRGLFLVRNMQMFGIFRCSQKNLQKRSNDNRALRADE